MKKIVMSAVASSMMLANLAMAEEVQVYGKANISLQQVKVEEGDQTTQDNFELLSNASRLGVKGDTEISEGVSAIYKMEFEVSLDDGDKGGQTLTQRNAYVGVKTGFGAFLGGMHDSPTKMLAKKVDIFSDLQFADIKNIVNGEERIKNAVMYRSPTMAGISVDAMFAPGEGDKADDRDGAADFTSIAISYQWQGLTVGLSRDDEISQDYTGNSELFRLIAAYDFENFGFSALATQSDQNDSASNVQQQGQIVTAYYKLGDFKLKALAGNSSITEDGVDDLDSSQVTVGVDYKLSKKSKVFAYYSAVEHDLFVDTDADDIRDAYTDSKENTIGLGLEHKF